jgi:hypothetical protein
MRRPGDSRVCEGVWLTERPIGSRRNLCPKRGGPSLGTELPNVLVRALPPSLATDLLGNVLLDTSNKLPVDTF